MVCLQHLAYFKHSIFVEYINTNKILITLLLPWIRDEDTVHQVTNPNNIPLNSLLMVQETLGINGPKCLTWLQKSEINCLHIFSPLLLGSHLLNTLLPSIKGLGSWLSFFPNFRYPREFKDQVQYPRNTQDSIHSFGLFSFKHLLLQLATGPCHHPWLLPFWNNKCQYSTQSEIFYLSTLHAFISTILISKAHLGIRASDLPIFFFPGVAVPICPLLFPTQPGSKVNHSDSGLFVTLTALAIKSQ